ncbi:Uncharacterized protein Adt_38604 [Abeliophyllum distichum]|uniref:Uncharacterized protein n=1 Tax=Abeliophyllum distichum TaxID=126358 RepID=A0ABD1Q4E0_9LAMI
MFSRQSPLSRTSENGNGSPRSGLRAGEVQNGSARWRLSSLGVLVSHSQSAPLSSLVSRPVGRQQTEVLHLESGRRQSALSNRQQACNALDSAVARLRLWSLTVSVVLGFCLLI